VYAWCWPCRWGWASRCSSPSTPPARVSRPFAYLIDLLAAVPSIIFGLWGILVLAPVIRPIAEWLNAHFGWIWLFRHGNVGPTGSNLFTAGIVLAAMLLPIITAITREVFSRTPTAQIEGALALGATKWEVIRTTVLPFGRAGYRERLRCWASAARWARPSR